MNCSDIQELLSAYYDGELADERRARMSEHLDVCSDCANELAGFEKLSNMAGALGTPAPPEHLWSQLEQQLEEQPVEEQPAVIAASATRRSSFPAPRLFVFAATVFIAVGIGWFAYRSWFPHGEHHQFTVEFGHYLEEFRRDPVAAQQILLAKYGSQLVEPDQVIQQVGYRPAVADGLPVGYRVESTHVIKMPCCTCVQSFCRRGDGSTLVIFEHDDEETTEWFGGRPEITTSCNGERCCLVELDDRIAASWKRGKRHMTLIGVQDVAEVNQMVAWLDEKRRPVPN